MNAPREQMDNTPRFSQARLLVGLVLLYGLAVAGYSVLRYQGQWTDGDSAVITRMIEVVRDQGTIHPAGPAYPHGFDYQAASLVILSATGLSLQTLQATVYPFLAVAGLALTSLAFFSQVTRDRWIAALATLFLFLQPDLLFVTLRGSHEKLDWPLMMVALMLLYRSVGRPLRTMVVYVALFYLTVFAMITTNVFFASTFLVAVVFSLVLGLVVKAFLRRSPTSPTDFRRLTYVGLSCGVLIFTFMAYVYPLALSNLRTLNTIADRVSAFLLSFEIKGQPYQSIPSAWVSPGVYLGLTAFTWFLIAASFAEWLRRGRQILGGREGLGLLENLDWLLYAGFAIQVGLSVIVDFAGVLSANMQLRVFPGFTVLAVVLLARAVGRVAASPWLRGWRRGAAIGLAGLAIAWFAVAAVFKATNEPLFSNKWVFYSSSEDTAVRWTEDHLHFANIWTGLDERIAAAFSFNYGRSQSGNVYDIYAFKSQDRYVLFSEREHQRGLRMRIAMPSTLAWSRVYDSGDVYLYHKRPQTPYQR
jgi:hypothetical protein